MSINTNRNRKQPGQTLQPILDNERLGSRNQLRLTTWIIAAMAEVLGQTGRSLTDLERPILAIAAALALAKRGIKPAHLNNTFLGSLIDDFVDLLHISDLRIDHTEFGRCLSATADPALVEDHKRCREKLLKTLSDNYVTSPQTQLLADPLFPGWVYQSILMGKNDYSFLRNEKSLAGLAQITQWFTPDWIATFLIDECFRHPLAEESAATTEERCAHSGLPANRDRALAPITFLDSSCGAGQILIPALKRLVQRRLDNDGQASDSISYVLTNELFGIDIDPLMIRLSGLSLYLFCRDVEPVAPLPIPNLFHFPNHGSDEFAGSLLLSINNGMPVVPLERVDGLVLSTQELPTQFDLQACNPPYLSHRLMPKELSNFLKKNYSDSHYDLYTAFLELGIRLLAPEGKLTLICQQSFLSTNRFEQLRRRLIERTRVNTIVQLGPGAFASRQGEKVNNAIITLTRRADAGIAPADSKDSADHQVTAYKLMSRTAKHSAEREGLAGYIVQKLDEDNFLRLTNTIPGFPLVPFCPNEIANLFQTHPSLSDSDFGITITNGLFTCDNKRFVRHFQNIDEHERAHFVPYDKGGGQKWYATTPYFLEWHNDGENIRSFRFDRGQSRALPGERFYFKEGITYSYIGTKGFKARMLSPGSVFDIASSAIFSEHISLRYLLGFFNSALVRFILGLLNPTVNFQIGDLRRLPFRKPPSRVEAHVGELAHDAVELAKTTDRLNSYSPIYDPQSLIMSPEESSGDMIDRISAHVFAINQKEAQIQRAIDEFIFDLYDISAETRTTISTNEWVTTTNGDLFSAAQMARCMRSLTERIT